MKRMICAIVALVLMACAASAADVDGKWKSEFTGPNGNTITSTMTFKADGSKLTGTISGRAGETPIENGKIDGDTITFTVTRKFQDNEFKMNYKGKVSGSEIKFTVEAGERSFEMTAKKI